MIKIVGITKKFGERTLFKNFSYTIKQGAFVVFSGKSGSGKTTLLNMIGGIETIDEGTIIVDDLDLTKSRDLIQLYREKIGFLFQNFALIDTKTVAENILLIDKKYRNELSITDALNKVGLMGYEKRKIFTLSGGEQQRVALARLFVKKCTIVLADEPTGSLDQDNADIVMQYLQELNNLKKTIIMVTHDERLKQMGEQIIEL